MQLRRLPILRRSRQPVLGRVNLATRAPVHRVWCASSTTASRAPPGRSSRRAKFPARRRARSVRMGRSAWPSPMVPVASAGPHRRS